MENSVLALKVLRVACGLSAYELAGRAKIAPSRLSLLERGLEAPTSEELDRLAAVLIYRAKEKDTLVKPVDTMRLREAVE
jgi:transcriptional regulator with XRE-family HTH domain